MAAHFTIAERQLLHRLLQRRLSKSEIAVLLHRHRSTIYRELQRNTSAFGYRPKHAQQLRDQRRQACGRQSKFSDPQTRLYVTEHLMQAWSPDQIAGRLRRDFPQHTARQLTAQTIYNWLHDLPLWRRRWLRHGSPRPAKPRKKPVEVCIRGRPAVINRRCRYGEWEGDTIVGKGRRNGLLTLLERKSGLVKIDKVNDLCSTAECHVRQWSGIYRLPHSHSQARASRLLRRSLLRLATGRQRERQRTHSPVLPQRNRLRQHPASRSKTSRATTESKTPSAIRLPNTTRSPRPQALSHLELDTAVLSSDVRPEASLPTAFLATAEHGHGCIVGP